MLKQALLLACLAANVSCTNRTVNWYVSIDSTNSTLNQMNANAVKQNKGVFSQLQLAWGPGMPDSGTLSGWNNETAVNAWLSMYKPLGVPVVPVVVNLINATTMHGLYKDPSGYAQQLVSIGKRYGFSGFNFDYEPEAPKDSDAKAYAEFLKAVNTILVSEGFTLSIWVAAWSGALNNYGVLAKSGIQYLQDMSTYGGASNSAVDHYVNAIKDATGSAAQAGIGLGPYHTDYWTDAKARQFISHATEKGCTSLDIFRLLMDGVNDWPAPYWYPVLQDFLSGKI